MTTTEATTTAQPTDESAVDPREGTIVWSEIQVENLAVAKEFYSALFGWTYGEFAPDFVVCMGSDGTMVAGLEERAGEPAGRHVRIYFQVSDLEATLDKARAAGGTVEAERELINEEFGWYAVIADPSGLKIGLATDRPARDRSA